MSYHADVEYEMWRSGRNPDSANYDRIENMRYDGYSAEEAAASELCRMREEEYCEDCGVA
jgi:hypothetical protein